MLSILHHYSHGYLVIPVLLSCKKRGLFNLLQQSQCTPFKQIVRELDANSGHLRSALHMLESLQIVSRNSEDAYALLTGWNVVEKIPEEIMELFDFPMKAYVKKSQRKHRLQKWIELSAKQWNIDNVMYAHFLDGMLMIPLLFSLKEHGLVMQSASQKQEFMFSNLSGIAKQEITQLFLQKNWLDQTKKNGSLTEAGMYMVDRIFNTAIIYSYRPMIKNIDQLLFGDCQAVFDRDVQEHESHIDRTLNVIGCGFQHEKYFKDMEQMIVSIFNRNSLEEQPKYIADMGCGDGSLLKKIYEIIKMKSLRGQVLDQYPLTLIGIDYNEKSLVETAVTLRDIDHVLLKGDIGNPNELITNLEKTGITDTENILHVRSFLDHDRSFIAPKEADEANSFHSIPTETVFVDKNGRERSSKLVMKNLVEHLQLWSNVVNKHGLILLEVHCLEPKTINQYIDKCESLHFDAVHRFSQQLLVEADTFILAAAEAGLFPHKQYFRKYPKSMPFARITLNYFEPREYRIRMAHEKDIPVLRQLELQCWGEDLGVPAERILHRIRNFPEGQLILEIDNRVVGVIYSQKIKGLQDIKSAQTNTVEQLHHNEGTIIQLLAINILPEMQDRNLGDQLLEFMLQRCSLISGVRSVIGITRCKDYHRHRTVSMDKYIALRNQNNKLIDKTLQFHEMHGAKIRALVPNYRPLDHANLGYGVLIEYDNLNRGYSEVHDKARKQVNLEKNFNYIKNENTDLARSITDFVLDSIRSLLGGNKEDVLSYVDRPLMELGLDSGDLLELNDQLGTKFQIELEATFFFTYNTAKKIISYFIEKGQVVYIHHEEEVAVASNEVQKIDDGSNMTNYGNLIKEFVMQAILVLLNEPEQDGELYINHPLMELGLDSGDLLELNDLISSKFQIELEATFFFTYNTARKIISYLIENTDVSDEVYVAEKSVSEKEAGSKSNSYLQKDIAIIGASCRLPGGVSNLEQLWELLIDNQDATGPMPKQRWNWPDTIYPDSEHKGINQGGFLDQIAEFDPLFFRISPTEAELLDPQQRLLMELSWECIEGANYSATAISGSNTGVFIGASGSDYSKLLDRHGDDVQAKYGIGTSMAILPNRISYFYNFHGPSLQIDTACSSSLVAVHQAVRSLQSGECEQALVGGVHLMCHPANSIAYYKAGMLSKDGKCKTFDKDAGGYVRGEGGVVLLLKPVKQAESDGDSILAVIKGTAINHGGQANGLTVPNPEKQATLIKEAFLSANIEPESVGYIEAHGTGTPLGDPIEIAALKEAFLELSKQNDNRGKPYCGLGSIKTNIGHLEAAAGLAGLVKVLVSLRHRMIPASLHFHELNPHMSIENSPFYIVNRNRDWIPTYKGGLRRAGISSFGSGGSNSHILIEEYPSTDKVALHNKTKGNNPVMIVLSAKNEERLQEYVKQLITAIEKQNLTDCNLADMAYTLHVGREAMEERYATVICHINELKKSLTDYLENNGMMKNYYRGNVNKSNSIASLPIEHEEENEMINHFIKKNDLHQLAYLWVSGLDIDWKILYKTGTANRISLPTYPFARERYWIPEIETSSFINKAKKTTVGSIHAIHPLLQQNTSYLTTIRFSSIFTGKEFFLEDHVVQGCKVLPGVAHLEMARIAVEQSLGNIEHNQGGFQLHNVVWKKPILLEEQPIQVHIRVFSANHGEISYEIYSEEIPGSGSTVVYSQGLAVRREARQAIALDVPTLQSTCKQGVLTARECYQAFNKIGLTYGESHQGIQSVYVGKDQVLAELVLPSCLVDTQEQYVLHPSVMDAALQAALVFQMQSLISYNTSIKPLLPFALESIEMLLPHTSRMWAHVRYSEDYIVGNETHKYDIDLCDDSGTVCVRMFGFSFRGLEGAVPSDCTTQSLSEEAMITPPFETMMIAPIWEPISSEKGQRAPSIDDNLVIVGGNETSWTEVRKQYPEARILAIQSGNSVDEIIQEMTQQGPIDHILWIAPDEGILSVTDNAIIEGQEAGVIYLFKIIKSLLSLGYESRQLGWTVITTQTQPIHKYDEVNPTHASVHGLMGTLAKEYPNWNIRVIDLESTTSWPMMDWFTLPIQSEGNPYVYREQQWHRQELVPVSYNQQDETMYKSGGVYVVIGGAGGLGEVWSEYVIRRYEAKVIWIGRREMDADIQAKIDRLASMGPAPRYIMADATDQEALYRAYEEIKQQYGELHGVVHSAIVLLDKSLANMDEERFRVGLGVKVEVSVNIAEVFQHEPLDFVLFFSSMNSFVKAAGQSNYVAGCTFKDAFASQLGIEWPCAVKVMNWGYWGTVGTVALEEYQKRMHKRGVGSIEPPEAMEALEALLTGPMNQLAFAKMTTSSTWLDVNRRKMITIY